MVPSDALRRSWTVSCPACSALAGPADEGYCPHCHISLTGPATAELYWVNTALAWGRKGLVRRRAELLTALRQERDELLLVAAPPAAAPPDAELIALRTAPPSAGAFTAWPAARGAEMSPRTVANLLLAVGAVLVIAAAGAFTARNWGSIPEVGQAGVLLGLASVALGAAWPLARRGLGATAEAIAAIGLALTAGSVFLIQVRAAAVPGNGFAKAAAGIAALGACWAIYGAFAPVKMPRIAAIVIAQAPLPLLAISVSPSLPAVALALMVTAGCDLTRAVLASRPGERPERVTATGAAVVTWLGGTGLALAAALPGPGLGRSLVISAVLLLASAIAALATVLSRAVVIRRDRNAAVAGALTALGLAIPVAAELPASWSAGAFAALGSAVAAAGWWGAGRIAADQDGPGGDAPKRGRLAFDAGHFGAGGAAVLAGAGAWATPAALSALCGPLSGLRMTWAGWAAFRHASLASVARPGDLVVPGTPAVLALVSLACLLAPVPASRRLPARAAAVVVAAFAAASIPAAAGLTGWAWLAVLTSVAAALLLSATIAPAAALAGTMATTGLAVAVGAALWSLATREATIAELAVLAVICAAAAARARIEWPAGLAAAGALAAATGLACAIPRAIGVPAACGFAVLCVAVLGVGVATRQRRARPVPALVLDVGAVPVLLLAVSLTAARAGLFSELAATAAIAAAAAARVRGGPRRSVALVATAVAVVAALVPQTWTLGRAVYLAFPALAPAWHGYPSGHASGPGLPGLPLALGVLAGCAVAVITAAGAWHGRQGSLDAAAVALPVVAAPIAAGGLTYGVALGLMLALTLALTGWAAISRTLAPAGAAVAAAAITVTWALAAAPSTLAVLGCLGAGYLLCAWRATLASVRVAAAVAAVTCVSALAGCSALAAGLPGWQAGFAMLIIAAAAQPASSRLGGRPGGRELPAGLAVAAAVEVTGWLAALVAVVPSMRQPGHAAIALAALAALCLAVSARPGRRFLRWAGLALAEAALCALLASHGVSAPEPYTVPAAIILIAFGWQRSRRSLELSSWLGYGPGLVLLLLPSLALAWPEHGWIRPLLLGLLATGVTLTGGRFRAQAPVLIGAAVVLLGAGRQFAPPIAHLAGTLPRWVPIALIGLALLAMGATYEARLRDLRRLRGTLGLMR